MEDKKIMENASLIVADETKHRDLILEDEEEDFLDDGIFKLLIIQFISSAEF